MSLFGENISLIRKLNWQRMTNIIRVRRSFYRSKRTKHPVVQGFPISLTIEPTTACNLGCPECPSGLKQFTRPEGNIKPEFYQKIIDQVYMRTFYLNFYFQGEPYINPGFLDMVRYANNKKMYSVLRLAPQQILLRTQR